jgi:hypothetical protein
VLWVRFSQVVDGAWDTDFCYAKRELGVRLLKVKCQCLPCFGNFRLPYHHESIIRLLLFAPARYLRRARHAHASVEIHVLSPDIGRKAASSSFLGELRCLEGSCLRCGFVVWAFAGRQHWLLGRGAPCHVRSSQSRLVDSRLEMVHMGSYSKTYFDALLKSNFSAVIK